MGPHPVIPPELRLRPFSLVEAHQAGLTRRQLQGRSWRRIGTDQYAWVGMPCGPELVLAAAPRRLPSDAVFSGRTAAWLHGLDFPPCDPVEVVVPDGCGISARSGIAVSRATLATGDVVVRRGLPATSALRTVFELGCRSPLVEAVVAVDMALRDGLVGHTELHKRAAMRTPLKGMRQFRRVVEFAEPKAESPMETRFRMLLVLAGLPRPAAQVSLHDDHGRFLGRADLYYRTHRRALEYDGGTHRSSLVEDNRRQNLLLNAGFRILRFTAADIRGTPTTVVDQVRAALRSTPP